jgi:hypothetical protein
MENRLNTAQFKALVAFDIALVGEMREMKSFLTRRWASLEQRLPTVLTITPEQAESLDADDKAAYHFAMAFAHHYPTTESGETDDE